jgi:hypothetical protein
MELAIHIIIACTVVALAICLLIIVKIVGDLESVVARMDRRIDYMKKMEHASRKPVDDEPRNGSWDLGIKVVEKLDFPNDPK